MKTLRLRLAEELPQLFHDGHYDPFSTQMRVAPSQEIGNNLMHTLSGAHSGDTTMLVNAETGEAKPVTPFMFTDPETGTVSGRHIKDNGFLHLKPKNWVLATTKYGKVGFTNLIEIGREGDNVTYVTYNPFGIYDPNTQERGKARRIEVAVTATTLTIDKGELNPGQSAVPVYLGQFHTIFGVKDVYATLFTGLRRFVLGLCVDPIKQYSQAVMFGNLMFNLDFTLRYERNSGKIAFGQFNPEEEKHMMACEYIVVPNKEQGAEIMILKVEDQYFVRDFISNSDIADKAFAAKGGVQIGTSIPSSEDVPNWDGTTTKEAYDTYAFGVETKRGFFFNGKHSNEFIDLETPLMEFAKIIINHKLVVNYSKKCTINSALEAQFDISELSTEHYDINVQAVRTVVRNMLQDQMVAHIVIAILLSDEGKEKEHRRSSHSDELSSDNLFAFALDLCVEAGYDIEALLEKAFKVKLGLGQANFDAFIKEHVIYVVKHKYSNNLGILEYREYKEASETSWYFKYYSHYYGVVDFVKVSDQMALFFTTDGTLQTSKGWICRTSTQILVVPKQGGSTEIRAYNLHDFNEYQVTNIGGTYFCFLSGMGLKHSEGESLAECLENIQKEAKLANRTVSLKYIHKNTNWCVSGIKGWAQQHAPYLATLLASYDSWNEVMESDVYATEYTVANNVTFPSGYNLFK